MNFHIMLCNRVRPLLALVLCVACASCSWAGERLSYEDLIGRLTDLEALAVLPAPGEKCQQWSSYERESRYDAKNGEYLAWSANADGNGIIRREGGKEVLAQIRGPGVIWRIWSAKPGDGHVKVYLDGLDEPAIDLPFRQYFDGTAPPFQGSSLCYTVASGWNCYVPIPFNKSCKIVADEGWGLYYHFTYTTYPQSVVLPTFKRKLSEAQGAALVRANTVLNMKRGSDPAGKRPGEVTVAQEVRVEAGDTVRIFELTGPRAVTALHAQLDLAAAPDSEALLRQLCLRITWDDQTRPAVWAPLADFFGSAPDFRKYKSLPMGVTDEGFYCFWYMPFAKRAVIELVNDGPTAASVTLRVTHAPLTRPVETLGRFHAKWHRDAFMPTEPGRKEIDWTMLKTQGRGRFVGVMLHVWNPRGGWWGEGDEKFFVDGERFPSTFGTGSEDYFGYAWGNPSLFEHAYHNQTRNDGGNHGHVCVNRWNITDNVPFQSSFEAAIEKYFENERPNLYSATAYWYLAPGQADGYDELPMQERWGLYVSPPPLPARGENVIECEDLEVVQCTRGRWLTYDLTGAGWQGIRHLLWWDGLPGDRFTVAFKVKTSARYKLTTQLAKAYHYGIVQLYLDDKKLGDPIDLYDARLALTGPLDMGSHQLEAGEHRLTMELVGANKRTVKNYMAGIDYIQLDEVE